MSYLLAISVGPVQEFIAAARRTRDLWFGSHLLSEISRAIAKSIESSGGELIFPANSRADNVANVILAQLKSGDPRAVAAAAKVAAKDHWREIAKSVRKNVERFLSTDPDIWNEQVDDVLEFYAAWVVHNDNLQYQHDRRRLMHLLNGRKACRGFEPALGHAGIPKSSLDGQRESVFKEMGTDRDNDFRRLRIRKGEQLDVVGVVKRLGEGDQPYPSVTRIAADPWVRGKADCLDDVLDACRELYAKKLLHKVNDDDAHPYFSAFPFEGSALYVNRHSELLEESGVDTDQCLFEPLRAALKNLPEPEPYLAVLVADGDRMGRAISNLKTAEEHREFSAQLAEFSGQAKAIVAKHFGCLIYAGGDDVLAFVPVDQCLPCARALSDRFREQLVDWSRKTNFELSLSVGVAIGHFMENLEDLLQMGRDAEKAAKSVVNKNALAIHLHKRGGSPIRVQDNWKNKMDRQITEFARLLHVNAIPSKLPYEMRELAKLYQTWPSNDDSSRQRLSQAIRADLNRMLSKKLSSTKAGRDYLLQEFESWPVAATALFELAERLLVARQMGRAFEQASPKPRKEPAGAS